jgi:kynurenine formamidase
MSLESMMKTFFAFLGPNGVPAVAALLVAIGSSACSPADSDLGRTYKTIAASKFVDLSHSFGPDTPVWSGFGQARFSPTVDPRTHEAYTIAKDGFHATSYDLVGQYGTHIDPPAHFAEGGLTLDQIPLEQMILPLVVLDETPQLSRDPNHAFSVDDLTAWEHEHGRVPPKSFVVLRTDMYKDWDANPERFKRTPFPGWTLETIKVLYEQRDVTATGHEALNADTTARMDSETYILQHGHYQIEAMANLDQVPATGALIVVAWPKVRGGLGFPARAFAIVP